jgi:drug/metabolite transporter (DMT)-like permease
MTFVTGILAALASPLVMTMGFLVWEDHWKGSAYALNMYKCCTASIGFLVLSLTIQSHHESTTEDSARGVLFPAEIFTAQSVGFLMLSSTIGILIGDWTWLQALQLMGARRVILMDSIKPFLAALFGWWLLDEDLRLAALGGIALTVTGILIVTLEQTNKSDEHEKNDDHTKIVQQVANTQACNGTQTPSFIGTEVALTDDVESTVQVHQLQSRNIKEDITLSTTLSEKRNCTTDSTSPNPCSPDLAVVDPQHSEPKDRDNERQKQDLKIGYLMSILNVVLDTYGAVLIKQHRSRMTVWDINLIRFGFAGLVMMCMSILLCCHEQIQYIFRKRQQRTTTTNMSLVDGIAKDPWYALPVQQMNRSSWMRVSAGVILVTFLTPTLSNYALFQIAVGLALTLTSIGPLYQMPLSYLMQKHSIPSLRSILGAILAVSGIVVLAFRGTLPEEQT